MTSSFSTFSSTLSIFSFQSLSVWCQSDCLLTSWKSLSHVQLCDPMNCTVHGILQSIILEWAATPFSRGSFQPRERTQVSHIAGGLFTSWATREAQLCISLTAFPDYDEVKYFFHYGSFGYFLLQIICLYHLLISLIGSVFLSSNFKYSLYVVGFPGGSDGKVSACNAGDPGSIPGLGRSPEEGNGNPLQYLCLENSMDRGVR